MEITRELVDGYVAAVAAALEAAGHKAEVSDPFYPDELKAEVVLPDALADEYGASGVALQYDVDGSWVAGRDAAGWVAAVYDHQGPDRRTMHTALFLGVVPEPEVVVRAVAAIVADGGFKAGRVAPGTAELLAAYAGGGPLKAAPLDLIAAASADEDSTFEACVVCGGGEVVQRAVYVSLDGNGPSRVAWCAGSGCQDDRVLSAARAVPVVRADGGYRVADGW